MGMFSGPRDARRSDGRWTDARPRGDVAEDARPRRRYRRLVLGALVAVIAATSLVAVFGEGGFLDVRRARHELDRHRAELWRQVDEIRRLRREVRALRDDPSAVERVAREDLGLVRPGEVVFLLPERESPPAQPKPAP